MASSRRSRLFVHNNLLISTIRLIYMSALIDDVTKTCSDGAVLMTGGQCRSGWWGTALFFWITYHSDESAPYIRYKLFTQMCHAHRPPCLPPQLTSYAADISSSPILVEFSALLCFCVIPSIADYNSCLTPCVLSSVTMPSMLNRFSDDLTRTCYLRTLPYTPVPE